MNTCLKCNKETTNPKYCSRSCSAKDTNQKYPKKKTKKKCIICSAPVISYRYNRCEKHWAEYKSEKHKDRTLKEFSELESVRGKHRSWMFVHVRQFARTWLKHLRIKPCANCGYDRHVELCHRKAIKDFPDTATLREVNAETNVIQLCPNCHWEYDNGLLTIH